MVAGAGGGGPGRVTAEAREASWRDGNVLQLMAVMGAQLCGCT